ncbi:MAG: type II toxin-antitoxin system PemK/MazF family toxin [Blastocatellia bacterium]|nr:type II toxin-antitoxin system PemK/MazF family toxin [Blastocatellia bacterium]
MAKTITTVLRGEVYLVRFDPVEGSEVGKTRPALVLQNDIANRTSPVTIVAAISSQFNPDHLYPTEVLIKAGKEGLTIDSVVLLNQIRTIDKARLLSLSGKVEPKTMLEVERAIKVSFGLLRPPIK